MLVCFLIVAVYFRWSNMLDRQQHWQSVSIVSGDLPCSINIVVLYCTTRTMIEQNMKHLLVPPFSCGTLHSHYLLLDVACIRVQKGQSNKIAWHSATEAIGTRSFLKSVLIQMTLCLVTFSSTQTIRSIS